MIFLTVIYSNSLSMCGYSCKYQTLLSQETGETSRPPRKTQQNSFRHLRVTVILVTRAHQSRLLTECNRNALSRERDRNHRRLNPRRDTFVLLG